MDAERPARLDFEFHPLTPDRWPDLERLFGPNGAYANCWCMWWRLSQAEFNAQSGVEKRAGLKAIVDAGDAPGILAYAAGRPVGWCAIQPREAYPRLNRSRIARPIDEQPVWSVVCFYVDRAYRRQGLTVALLEAAAEYARSQGATIVEGYPNEPGEKKTGSSALYLGVASAFRRAGFVEVARGLNNRPIMRRYLEG